MHILNKNINNTTKLEDNIYIKIVSTVSILKHYGINFKDVNNAL